MKRLSLLLLLLGVMLHSMAQMPIGEWRAHMAYHNATQCLAVGERIFVLSDGSIYAYTPGDTYVETYTKTTGLSDQGIKYMVYSEAEKILTLIYENANIDFLLPNDELYNLTDFKEKSTLDPTINDVVLCDKEVYLATNFGMTLVNLSKKEFANTYTLNCKVNSCLKHNNWIVAATEKGIYLGDCSLNLLDINNWKTANTTVYRRLFCYNNQLFALKEKEGLFTINETTGEATKFLNGSFSFVNVSHGQLIVGNGNSVSIFFSMEEKKYYSFEGTLNYLTFDGTTYWASCGKQGLVGYQLNQTTQTLEKSISSILPDSPIRNYCQYLNFVDNDRLLIAGGCLNYFDLTFYDGTLMVYEDETWKSFQEEGIADSTKVHYKNMTSIVQDPTDPTHHYASSFGQGIYEFKNYRFVRQLTCTNSTLESAVPNSLRYTRVSRMKYDKDNNLWITNCQAQSPVKILKPSGELIDLYYKEIEYLPTITDILFDSRGLTWIVSMRADAGVLCIDNNGTIENTADDKVKFIDNKFVDQDGNSTTIDYIYSITEDKDGILWFGTNQGPYVLYNPEKVLTGNFNFTKIKVPRNDGSNYADYLLDGVYTTCICIDQANRKWIGTQNNGVYLISADGLETIHHFTEENSPLLSNTVDNIAIRHQTGEVFIATSGGLISYMGDATTPADNYKKSNVYAYPNPVHPDYNGLITVVGLKENSTIKITNTAGRLMAEGTSLGGSFCWDGKTKTGDRVATGIYFVIASDETGKEGIVTKILMIK